MKLPSRKLTAFLLALAACACLLLLSACPKERETGDDGKTITGKHLGGGQGQQFQPLIYIAGGKLMLMDEGGASKPLSAEGRPEIPVSSFDVNLSTGEVALACGGRVGVVPLQPKAQVKPQDEEWHDLRFQAGNDTFIQLVRLSPDASTIYAQTYQAGTVDEGFRLLALSRQTQKISEIKLPAEARLMELRGLKLDSDGTPYIFIYDETVPESILYRVTGGKAEKIFSSEDVLGSGDGADYNAPMAEAQGAYALEVDDFFPQGNELLLPVFMLVEEKKQQAPDGTQELLERTEVWRLDLVGKSISKRYTLSNEPKDTQTDYSFELDGGILYFARLAFPEQAKPNETPAEGGKQQAGTPSAPAGQPEDEAASDQPPKDFSLMRLELASGEVSTAFKSPLKGDFFGLAVFPAANALGVLYGNEESLRLDGFDLGGNGLQAGIAVDSPEIIYLPGK
jgi:hypothetical protein